MKTKPKIPKIVSSEEIADISAGNTFRPLNTWRDVATSLYDLHKGKLMPEEETQVLRAFYKMNKQENSLVTDFENMRFQMDEIIKKLKTS